MKLGGLSFILLCFLSGCAQAVETRISSRGVAGSAAVSPGGFIILDDAKAVGSEMRTAHDLVISSLAKRGYLPASAPQYNLAVTVSSRPAPLLVKIGNTPAVPANGKAKPKRIFAPCAKVEYRLAVVLTRIADGVVAYHGTAAEHHCKASLSQTLPALIDAALGDLGTPRGDYVVKRKALI